MAGRGGSAAVLRVGLEEVACPIRASSGRALCLWMYVNGWSREYSAAAQGRHACGACVLSCVLCAMAMLVASRMDTGGMASRSQSSASPRFTLSLSEIPCGDSSTASPADADG
jgi:hypothetical protein